MWAFDGEWNQTIRDLDIPNSNYLLDDEMPVDVKNDNNSATQQFWCPPDLLRRCTVNPNIGGIFSHSGFYGRIPAYLLKPVPNLTSISNMFSTCGNIVAYATVENGTYVTIPSTFFAYTPSLTNLTGAFSHCSFYSNPDVFGVLKGYLNLESVFFACMWRGGTSTSKFQLTGIFASNKVTNCASAFEGSYSDATRNQYVQFNDIFSTDKTMHPESADNKVFYGYASGNNCTHEARPTCSLLAAKKNYLFYGQ